MRSGGGQLGPAAAGAGRGRLQLARHCLLLDRHDRRVPGPGLSARGQFVPSRCCHSCQTCITPLYNMGIRNQLSVTCFAPQDLAEDVPDHEFLEHYGPSYQMFTVGRPALRPDLNDRGEVMQQCDALLDVLAHAVGGQAAGGSAAGSAAPLAVQPAEAGPSRKRHRVDEQPG